jgi:hypothetical protein
MSGTARSSTPLLSKTTYTEFSQFWMASITFGPFSFGIVNSISCTDMSSASMKVVCLDSACFAHKEYILLLSHTAEYFFGK